MKYLFLFLAFAISSNISSQSYLQKGIDLYKEGKIEEASSVFASKLFTDKSPQHKAPINYWYAKSLFNLNPRNPEVIKLIKETIELDENNTDYHFQYAQMLIIDKDQLSLAQESYRKVLNSTSANSYQKSVSSLYVNGYDDAVNELNNINQSNNANYYYINAVIKTLIGDEPYALKMLEEALQNGYITYDFLIIDFKALKDNVKFYEILDKYKVPDSFYKDVYFEKKHEESQDIFVDNLRYHVKKYVERRINKWQKKGKFEKTNDYLKRVNPETREQKIQYYTQQGLDSIGMTKITGYEVTNEYDADNETFKIIFEGLDPIFVNVPINEAPSFDNNFKELEYNDIKFTLSGLSSLSILQINITNPVNSNTYMYNSDIDVAFQSSQLEFSFDDVELALNETKKSRPNANPNTTKVITVGKSDIDTNIPIVDKKDQNTYALIIGNEDYTKYQNNLETEVNVDYAKRDATIFAEYAEKTLGIPSSNITLITDAISSQMNREIDKLSKLAKYSDGEATLLFYYAGHGFPDEETKESYIMPVDISGTNVKAGIKLNDLYSKLTSNNAKKAVVILDACFSGGGRNQGLLASRGVAIKPKAENITGNIVVFSSSSGTQSSLPYHNKQHGMFTYFFLKKLKESKGDISFEEIKDYVVKEVQLNAVKINNKEQNPQILVSPDIENIWTDWRF